MLLLAGPLAARQKAATPATQSPRPAPASNCGQLADRLLSATGYSNTLRSVTQIWRRQFQNGLAGFPNLTEAQKRQVDDAFSHAFDPVRLRARVRARLVSRCDVATYNAVLTALASPLAQRMHRIEAEAGTPAGSQALRRYFDQIRTHPPSNARVALVERLEMSRQEPQLLVNLLTAMARETAIGFHTPPPSDADVHQSMQQYLPFASRMILLQGLAVYRNAPDRDLIRYSAMWQSAPFQRFNAILSQSFVAAFGRGVREAAQAVRPFLGKAPPGPKP
jgi:hypothetical protein